MTEKEKMLAGELYFAGGDPELKKQIMYAQKLCGIYNNISVNYNFNYIFDWVSFIYIFRPNWCR